MTIPKVLKMWEKGENWYMKERMREPGHFPYYPHVICHAFVNLMKNNPSLTSKELEQILDKAIETLDKIQQGNWHSRKDDFYQEHFLEIRCLDSDSQTKTCFINDKSDAMYPLMLVPSRDRDDAFLGMLKEIKLSWSQIYEILNTKARSEIWSDTIQREIEEHVKPVERRNY